MDARHPVFALLQEWPRQTLAETEAIRAQNWPAVAACQDAKAELQKLLSQHPALTLRTAAPAAADPDGPLRKFVQEVLALEQSNRELVASQKAALEVRRLKLHDTSRNLQRVHHSYARAAGSRWQSYS